MNAPLPLRYTLVYGPLSRVAFTLTPEQLRIEGGRLRTFEVPLTALDAFYVKPLRIEAHGPRTMVANAAMSALAFDARLWLKWTSGGKAMSRRVEVSQRDPSFVALLAGLSRARPAANFTQLGEDEARRRMGYWSRNAIAAVTVAAVVLAVGVAVAIAILTKHA